MHLPTEFVVTAPEPYGSALAYHTRARTTLGVLIQLLAESRELIIISAPYMQEGHGLSSGPLSTALEAALSRGVNVTIISTSTSLDTLDQKRLAESGTGELRLYCPFQNMLDERKLGSHAKFCVADGTAAYVGSANLTSPGLGSQIEMGVLLRGDVARQIQNFWLYAMEIGLIVQIT